jgi:hypothetical protein
MRLAVQPSGPRSAPRTRQQLSTRACAQCVRERQLVTLPRLPGRRAALAAPARAADGPDAAATEAHQDPQVADPPLDAQDQQNAVQEEDSVGVR